MKRRRYVPPIGKPRKTEAGYSFLTNQDFFGEENTSNLSSRNFLSIKDLQFNTPLALGDREALRYDILEKSPKYKYIQREIRRFSTRRTPPRTLGRPYKRESGGTT
ncbi:MAG: hypothetical protein QNJ51_21155 [Calothrix sp. MO_167.B12]|nr:hypothetical protein [Calothrix sp. MO_167.B12]